MAEVSVRPATGTDAAAIGRIQVLTWRTAYADLLPAAVLDSVDETTAAAAWESAIGSADGHAHVLVAVDSGETVGFCALSDAEAEDAAGRPSTLLGALLVEPRWGRRGHGSRLLAAAVDHARADGLERAVMWVLEGDRVTQDFLASAGWQPEGLVRALDTGAGELREVRLHTDLTE